MFDNYSLELAKIFKWAEKEMLNLKHPYVGTEHLLLSILKNCNDIECILKKYNVTYDIFRNKIIELIGSASKKSNYVLWTPLLKRIVKNSELKKTEKSKITPHDLLKSLLEEDDGIAIRILNEMNVELDSVYLDLKDDNTNSNRLELYSLGKNLQDIVNMNETVVGRDKEISKIIEVLIRKNKNNPLLIGEAGVGKTAIVEELARRINNGKVPLKIKNKKIIMLEMASLVAGTKYRGEFEEKLNRIIRELENNPDIILFIDEIHAMVNAGGAEGAINASDILKPYMARGSIKIIGATTTNEYNKYILKDKALARRLEVINIFEPGYNETINILNGIKESYELYYNINISDNNIKTIVDYTSKYLKNSYNPDKSIAMLDLLCAKKSLIECEERNNKIINKLKQIKEEKNNMVKNNNYKKALEYYTAEKRLEKEINENNKTELSDKEIGEFIKDYCNINNSISVDKMQILEKKLKEKISGQDLAINKIIKGLKANFKSCLPSFLLIGSSGVGKKETVQLISKCLNRKLVRIDMKDYSNPFSIYKLIGGEPGVLYNNDECEFDKIKYNPNSVLLIENIEEANIQIYNMIKKILEERIINNNKGDKIDFSFTYIFITTNNCSNSKIGFLNHNNIESKLNESELKVDNIINYYNYKQNGSKFIKNYLEKV